MGNKERRRKRESTRKVPVVVREHIVLGGKPRSKPIVGEVSMKPVECPEDHKPFKDVGSFIHHMWGMHGWQSTEALIYWADNYRAEELEDE